MKFNVTQTTTNYHGKPVIAVSNCRNKRYPRLTYCSLDRKPLIALYMATIGTSKIIENTVKIRYKDCYV